MLPAQGRHAAPKIDSSTPNTTPFSAEVGNGAQKLKILTNFYQILRYKQVTGAFVARSIFTKFSGIVDHNVKIREIQSRGSRATGILICGGPVAPEF